MRPRHFLYILLLLPVFIFRDYTPSNELKYVSIVDEALENNTWFAFYNHGEPYADKPPLFFWGMMAAKKVTGHHYIWLIGLMSLFSAAGVMAVCDRWMSRAGIAHDPLTSNLLLGTSLMFLGAAAVVRMDMMMLFFIVLSLYTFYKLYSGQGRPRDRWLLPLWIFMAVFSKGPVGLFVPVLSVVVFLAVKRDIRSIGRFLGWRQWSLMLGLSALWFALVFLDGGREYLENLLVKQTVGRGVDAWHHKEPVYYYLVHVFWMLAPWTVLYIAAVWAGLKNKLIAEDTRTLFLCTIVTTFVLLSAFSSKVQIYLLPIFPFAAYLASAFTYRLGGNRWVRIGAAVPGVLFLLAFPASFIAPKFTPFEFDNIVPFHIGLFLLSAGAGVSLWFVYKKAVSRAVAVLGFSLLLGLSVCSTGLGQLNQYIGYGAMAEAGMEIARERGVTGYAYFNFYKGQNMDVYLGRDIRKVETIGELRSLIDSDSRTVLYVRERDMVNIEGLGSELERGELVADLYKYRIYLVGGVDRIPRQTPADGPAE